MGIIQLLAFVVIVIFLGYELFLLKKEHEKSTKPKIPNFNPSAISNSSSQEVMVTAKPETEETVHRSNKLLIIVLFLMLILLTGVGIFSTFSTKSNSSSSTNEPKVIIQTVNSKGIKIFNSQWQEISATVLQTPQVGTELIIGLETIPETDIDYARIRINENNWKPEHITNQFDQNNKVFFRKYYIQLGIGQLKIDAELHSAKDGWLGD